jgi:hypothetical protein
VVGIEERTVVERVKAEERFDALEIEVAVDLGLVLLLVLENHELDRGQAVEDPHEQQNLVILQISNY